MLFGYYMGTFFIQVMFFWQLLWYRFSLTTNQKLFIGAVRSNSLDSKKFAIITKEMMDKTLEDVDNKTGVIRIIAINLSATKWVVKLILYT